MNNDPFFDLYNSSGSPVLDDNNPDFITCVGVFDRGLNMVGVLTEGMTVLKLDVGMSETLDWQFSVNEEEIRRGLIPHGCDILTFPSFITGDNWLIDLTNSVTTLYKGAKRPNLANVWVLDCECITLIIQ